MTTKAILGLFLLGKEVAARCRTGLPGIGDTCMLDGDFDAHCDNETETCICSENFISRAYDRGICEENFAPTFVDIIDLIEPSDSCDCGQSEPVTTQDIEQLTQELRELFDDTPPDPEVTDNRPDHPLLANTVRLTFHDCGGLHTDTDVYKERDLNFNWKATCDGCLNIKNPENKGLEYGIKNLEQFYAERRWYRKFNRADFWAIAGTIALEYGVELDDINIDKMPEIGYFCGRQTCHSSPFTKNMFKFPSATSCFQDILDWFFPRFNFTTRDIVALLGVHTLGMTHKENSGFHGPWVKNKAAFNNEWFQQLKSFYQLAPEITPFHRSKYIQDIFNKWEQVEITPGRFQWTRKVITKKPNNARRLTHDYVDPYAPAPTQPYNPPTYPAPAPTEGYINDPYAAPAPTDGNSGYLYMPGEEVYVYRDPTNYPTPGPTPAPTRNQALGPDEEVIDIMMLNADMVTERNICGPDRENEDKYVDKNTGESFFYKKDNREARGSSIAAQGEGIEYQEDNEAWLVTFSILYRRMITVNEPVSGLCRIKSPFHQPVV
jgi:hypothetical protein